MRFGVVSDAHANLPALTAALAALDAEQCDFVVHTGDAIGIGPHPAECLDLLLGRGVQMVMGNHDSYFAFGLADWPYSAGELAHQKWVHEQIDPSLRAVVAAWPWEIRTAVEGHNVVFTHYGRRQGTFAHPTYGTSIAELDSRWAPPGINTTIADLDAMFSETAADVVFFGHDHQSLDGVASRRYVNPGSLGCGTTAEAGAAVAEAEPDGISIRRLSVEYDDRSVFEDLESREVPERDLIRRLFLSRG